MSFLATMHNSGFGQALGKIDPVDRVVGGSFANVFASKPPPPPPGVPNPNDAANAAQSQTDAMRQRRGLLANIYAGQSGGAPVTGKQQLGT